MEKVIKISDLEELLKKMDKVKVKKECDAQGCVTPHYEEYVTVADILFLVKNFVK